MEDVEAQRGEDMRKVLGAVFVIFLVFALKFGFSAIPSSEDDREVRIPLSEISEKAQWYEYRTGEKVVKFFVVKAGNDIKTGFDACDVCYRAGKGYSHEGSFMVCNNCGNRYPVHGLGTENRTGGCWPGYLPSSVRGGYCVIEKSELEKGTWRFP